MAGMIVNNNEQLGSFSNRSNLSRQPQLVRGDVPAASILVVYATESSRESITAALSGFEHNLVRAATTAQAMTVLTRQTVDLALIDLATTEPGPLELCRFLKKNAATQFLPVYVIGSCDDTEEEVRALEAGADEFLARPLRPRAFRARVQATLRHKAMIDSLDDSENVLFSLAQSVEDRDPELGQHCHRLALMGAAMGLTMGLPQPDIFSLQRAGYLHDIGKITIPDRVLFKPGPLSPAEWEMMKTHAERGERICGGVKSLISVLPIIRHHHERWDGSGYPDHLQGEEIPLLARILQLADIYDALTTARPYKDAMTPEQALRTIRAEAERGWRDPKLVEMFGDVLPTFRTPSTADQSNFSLHALAASVERHRKGPVLLNKAMAKATIPSEFKLVSGF